MNSYANNNVPQNTVMNDNMSDYMAFSSRSAQTNGRASDNQSQKQRLVNYNLKSNKKLAAMTHSPTNTFNNATTDVSENGVENLPPTPKYR